MFAFEIEKALLLGMVALFPCFLNAKERERTTFLTEPRLSFLRQNKTERSEIGKPEIGKPEIVRLEIEKESDSISLEEQKNSHSLKKEKDHLLDRLSDLLRELKDIVTEKREDLLTYKEPHTESYREEELTSLLLPLEEKIMNLEKEQFFNFFEKEELSYFQEIQKELRQKLVEIILRRLEVKGATLAEQETRLKEIFYKWVAVILAIKSNKLQAE
jgi:hypothetical protein